MCERLDSLRIESEVVEVGKLEETCYRLVDKGIRIIDSHPLDLSLTQNVYSVYAFRRIRSP